MNSRDPAWLNGVRESPSQAYAWHSVDHRQFCVLPSFENGNRGGPAVFAMWGRALSDGQIYPLPPSTYLLSLEPLGSADGGRQRYRWRAETFGRLGHNIPIEMQEVEADWSDNGVMRLRSPGPVAPELIEQGWETEAAPTVFYPDRSLWEPARWGVGEGREELPQPYSHPYDSQQVAPVVAEFDEVFQQVYLRGASTRRWCREGNV